MNPSQPMLAAVVMDPVVPVVVGVFFVALLVGLLLRRVGQPQVVAYLVVGIVLGPDVLGLVDDQALVARIGDAGVVLLLFFVGMEVSLPRLIAGWRVALLGTGLQIAASIGVAFVVGALFAWPVQRSVLLGLVISLSSTAVAVALLKARGQMDSQVGRDALGILLAQDVAIAPMLIAVGAMSGESPDPVQISLQVIGTLLIIGLLAYVVRRGDRVKLPLARVLKEDHELQVFAALLICFGFGLLTALAGLSTALGAFIAGIFVASARETDWVHHSLEPFRVVLVALFFVSVGLLVDLTFVAENWRTIALLVGGTLLTNTLINAAALKTLGRSWRQALYVGALLAQIGELSFLLAAVGRNLGILSQYGYQLAIAVIALTLLLSPAWLGVTRVVEPRAPEAPADPG